MTNHENPPKGWYVFGTHLDYRGRVEFSTELHEDGLPLWERPIHEPTKGAAVAMGTTCECGQWFPSHNDYLKHVEQESMSYPQ